RHCYPSRPLFAELSRGIPMGRGDRKTRKGKIAIRSYGNVRPHADANAVATKPKATSKSATKTASKTAAKPAAKTATKSVAKKAPAKKAAAKKAE
ncbi:30S ribosomal protein THX, partial [Dokdonella sp.]|uniref:30S ribosomal protein THX n=1 Tax=Dokdonella sp. TaxID=2291710 RepID=UPI003C62E413